MILFINAAVNIMSSVEKYQRGEIEMKTLKRITAIILFIAALCPMFVFSCAAAYVDDVWWSECNGFEENLYPVIGELLTGQNDVLVNDGCLVFNAKNSGYYSISITVDPSESKRGAGFEIATIDDDNEANVVFSNGGPCLCIDEVDDGKGYKGIIFFINKPGTYYARFTYDEYINNKCVIGDIFACSADIRYLGDIVSVSFGKDPLYIGKDISLVWPDEDYHTVGFRCTFTFSDGNTYLSGSCGRVDELTSGKRTLRFSLSNGPSIEIKVNLASLMDLLEEIVLPDDFTPTIIYHFDPHYITAYSYASGKSFSHPEYFEMTFTDGSVKRIPFDMEDATHDRCHFVFSLGGEDHSTWAYYILDDYGNNYVYRVLVDDICFFDIPANTVSSCASDFNVFLSEARGILKSLRADFFIDTVKSAVAVSHEMLNLTKSYIKYLRFIVRNNITVI